MYTWDQFLYEVDLQLPEMALLLITLASLLPFSWSKVCQVQSRQRRILDQQIPFQ